MLSSLMTQHWQRLAGSIDFDPIHPSCALRSLSVSLSLSLAGVLQEEVLQQWISARNHAGAKLLYPDVMPCLDTGFGEAASVHESKGRVE